MSAEAAGTLRHTVPMLRLASGRTLSPACCAYRTLGRLNAAGDNAVLVLHGYTTGPAMLDPGANVAEGSWSELVGPGRAIVAFSAICAHKLAYPTREVTFIRYKAQQSATSDAGVIHCCADHSVYDPAGGARVVSGPAPQPLAAIVLDHDPATDQLVATATLGAEQFDAFFAKYAFKLALEYGEGKARRPVGERSVVRELAQYCRQTINC